MHSKLRSELCNGTELLVPLQLKSNCRNKISAIIAKNNLSAHSIQNVSTSQQTATATEQH